MHDYSDIGNLLRAARQERRLSLPQVATRLHIRQRYLEALESGDFSQLPGLSYMRGYLLNYAGFLDLDKEELIRRFEQIEYSLERKGFYMPKVFSKDKLPSERLVWSALGAGLVVYMLWGFAQPRHYEVSIAEEFPVKQPERVHLTAEIAQSVACLQRQNQYYPLCHLQAQVRGYQLPQYRRYESVMELYDPSQDL